MQVHTNDNQRVYCIEGAVSESLMCKIEGYMQEANVDTQSLNMAATRYRFISRELANELTGVYKKYVSSIGRVFGDMRIIDYAMGGDIQIHYDGYQVEDGDISTHSFLLYLTDSASEAGESDGATNFFTDLSGDTCWLSVIPKRGMLVVFEHRIAHKGEMVYTQKRLLRGDLLIC